MLLYLPFRCTQMNIVTKSWILKGLVMFLQIFNILIVILVSGSPWYFWNCPDLVYEFDRDESWNGLGLNRGGPDWWLCSLSVTYFEILLKDENKTQAIQHTAQSFNLLLSTSSSKWYPFQSSPSPPLSPHFNPDTVDVTLFLDKRSGRGSQT